MTTLFVSGAQQADLPLLADLQNEVKVQQVNKCVAKIFYQVVQNHLFIFVLQYFCELLIMLIV